MYYILVSSLKDDLTPILNMRKNDVKWCEPNGYEIKAEYHYKTRNGTRLCDCFSLKDDIQRNVNFSDNELNLWHGYLLDESPMLHRKKMCPQENYYGVYSHASIRHDNCWFATDEIGLSPLYYSVEKKYMRGGEEKRTVFISNNPHLIAVYKRELGIKVEVEPTLSVWHTIGITNESNVTGYRGVYRVEPWTYICLDSRDNINFPSKNRMFFHTKYEDACIDSIKQLRKGMETINNKYSKRYAQLTGGFDSRLVLAFIMDNGVQNSYKFITNGNEQNPDCIVAAMIAKKFELNHQWQKRKEYERETERKKIDDTVREALMWNAMESGLVRMQGFMGIDTDEVCLNGMGAAFAKSFGFAKGFKTLMCRHFRSQKIDFENLSYEQQAYAYSCFGYADADRMYLTEMGMEAADNFRKRLFDFTYNRFPENMNYADSMSAYRWRIHNCNLSSMENNCIFLYSPIVLESSRKLEPILRQEGKLYFDIMWRLKPELCLIPYENRTYHQEIYKEFPEEIKGIFKKIPPVTGSIVSENQVNFFDDLLPILREELLDILPDHVFNYVRKDTIESKLKEELVFGKPVFALINLYGLAKWYELIKDFNQKIV